jgi:hypothetical protein
MNRAMHQLARYFFTMCSALSLLLCVQLVGCSCLSYSDEDAGLIVTTSSCCVRVLQSNVLVYNDWIDPTINPDASVLGIRWVADRSADDGHRRWALAVPLLWAVGACLAVPFYWIVRRVRRRERDVDGHCPACGYDLRASFERCPECGAASPRAV